MASPHLSEGLANGPFAETSQYLTVAHNQKVSSLLEGELLDLYGSFLIVIPVALFLKSLWL